MSSTVRRPATAVLAASLLAAACHPGDGGLDTCETDCMPITLHASVDGVPVEDGALLPWQYGFQGGVMVRTVVELEGSGPAARDMVQVDVRHEVDPAAPDAYGEVGSFERASFRRYVDMVDGVARLDILDDQIGFGDPTGARFVYTLEVRGSTYRGALSAAVELAPMETLASCDGIPLQDGGCAYRVLEGTGTVVTAPSAEGACVDTLAIAASFAHPMADQCIADLGFAAAPTRVSLPGSYDAACLESAGLSLDATMPLTFRVIERGTCTPTLLEADLSTFALDACGCGG